ncbi:MAG: hypothetical protein V3U65_19045 [Granulosicoccaceae bacterium]
MSPIALTTVATDQLKITGSDSPKVLLIDSVFESISVKRVTVHRNRILRIWHRYKSLRELQRANPTCAIYWCALDRDNGYLCVSNLSLSEHVKIDVDSYIAQSKRLKMVCSQLMSIGNGLPRKYRQVLMVINSPLGVRHVYFVDHKPVFTRALPPVSGVTDYIEPLQSTLQHLLNRGMLEDYPSILCHGVCAAAQSSIRENWAASTIDTLDNNAYSISSIAAKAYAAKRIQRFATAQLPAYWLDGIDRYRYRGASLLSSSIVFVLAMVLAAGLLGIKLKNWSALLRTHASITSTVNSTQLLSAQAAAFSSAPKITAQRLHRLDLLRSLQPAGPDVLLSTVSSVFEAHPHVTLNHISWYTVIADDDFKSQTQVAHRTHLSIDVVSSDYLSIIITGNIKAGSLSEQQALFSKFKATLVSLQGIGDLIEEQTPVTQWRMPGSETSQASELTDDSFTLRFSLSDASS